MEYILKKSWRSRRLRVVIKEDGQVVVSAPHFLRLAIIEKFLHDHTDWIESKVEKMKKMPKVVKIKGGKRHYQEHKEMARILITQKINKLNLVYNFSFVKIAIKNQKRRWGSCSHKGNLNFNYKILFLPDRLAEYIVAHELCHLKQFNHSADFWKLVPMV
ncbi:MAG: hypothetical protein US58_C0007G0009 [Candidatus Magasanikbacteria bacterium GW2011_GWA2_37_8]|uniref:YgjP-like metallopeptidase domain-containing protein n=1 Tax=Candidatus Magasanikbacteria bacterium GW2011_GWA2_37_8 TaxID=1619036 RepID=A0A0G0HCT4_9BACT|nr:MAG: hypothetical protein US58_C0007G0009 [Candidatus Magasanikbacteria bacterium GW2011_GWA2_37_8]